MPEDYNGRMPKDVKDFLNDRLIQLRTLGTEAINGNAALNTVLQELQSLGVVCVMEVSFDFKLLLADTFVPPKDLSKLTGAQLDSQFSEDDVKFLKDVNLSFDEKGKK